MVALSFSAVVHYTCDASIGSNKGVEVVVEP